MVTFGTGIGIALINDGKLVPNAELGHIELDGHRRGNQGRRVRPRAGRAQLGTVGQAGVKIPAHLENLLWPELFILGGGISKKPEKWVPLLKNRTPLVVAQLINNAGIVGAALAANEAQKGLELGAPESPAESTTTLTLD